jgi:hypothetical protein
MDGFYTTNGKTARGYYKSPDLPYYYSLFPQFTLCANYFCGALSETYPNRLVLYSGTSGGNTSNNGTLNYPCVLDLLSGNGITFKNYNFHHPANLRLIHCPTPAHQAVIPAATLVMNATAMPLYGHRSHIHDRWVFIDGQYVGPTT